MDGAIARGLRARHDGARRNPWNEFECGSHCARSLASWAVLTALQGYSCGTPERRLGFAPRLHPEDWRGIWSVDGAWGTFEQRLEPEQSSAALSVDVGTLPLRTLVLGSVLARAQVAASVDGLHVAAKAKANQRGLVTGFEPELCLSAGRRLQLTIG